MCHGFDARELLRGALRQIKWRQMALFGDNAKMRILPAGDLGRWCRSPHSGRHI